MEKWSRTLWRTKSLFIFLVFCLSTSTSGDGNPGADLPGHMQPLGSHRPPVLVQRIQHLPTPAEFHRTYVQPKVPVVMEGALNGATVWRNWKNDDYLRAKFGDEEIEVEEGKKENRSDPRFTLPFKTYLDRYQTEDIYMVADLPRPMYEEWEVPRPLVCGGFLSSITYTYIWFSSGGTNSVLHTDSFENFHCLVSGQKRFSMFEPHFNKTIGPEHEVKGFYNVDVEKVDMTKYPALSKIPWYLAEVNEGDCLYLPFLWIHNVKSFGRNMGINLWWTQFKFDEADCPPDEHIPEYFSLGAVEMSPELMILEALKRAAGPDGSVRAEVLHRLINAMDSLVKLDAVMELFERLQPGCGGVIQDYNNIPRANLKKAHTYMTKEWEGPPPPEGDREFHDTPPDWAEAGQSPDWAEDDGEGGGDGSIDTHDEL